MAFADDIGRADNAVRGRLGGVSVTYDPTVGAAVVVTGMFDENYVLVEASDIGVEQTAPAVWLELDDLPAHPDADDPTLTIGGTAYKVVERKPDGLGTMILVLHKVTI